MLVSGVSELEGSLSAVTPEVLAAAHRLGHEGSYYAFYLGLFQIRAGQREAGEATLRSFCQMVDSNPQEWGVTMRWEARYARKILDKKKCLRGNPGGAKFYSEGATFNVQLNW